MQGRRNQPQPIKRIRLVRKKLIHLKRNLNPIKKRLIESKKSPTLIKGKKLCQKLVRKHKPACLLTICLLAALLVILCSKKAPETDIQNKDYLYEQLIEAGYSPAGACGILGNIMQESAFDPSACQKKGNDLYWGIAGWRKEYFSDYDEAQYEDFAYCTEYLINSLKNSRYDSLREYLMQATDPGQAAQEFCVDYERCVDGTDPYTSGILHPELVGNLYQDLNKRVAYAEDFYQDYTNHADSQTAL